METRCYALSIIEARSLEAKLSPPPSGLTDHEPGPALLVERPARPPGLEIRPGREVKVPPIGGMHEPAQRARILHGFANHEFQAVELLAWALLAFPDAPAAFRRGLLEILEEEQRHCRMYIGRLESLGVRFGDYPVSGYFWNKLAAVETLLEFVCTLSLTFENANLDHTVEYAAAARAVGDEKTAAVIDQIHQDEILHVRFGAHWLRCLKDPAQSMSEAYRQSVRWPLRPALARGKTFHPEGRRAAGLDPDFIELLAASERDEGDEKEK